MDDDGTGSTYVDSIFWKNTLGGGISPAPRYELDITDGAGVRGSFIHGDVNDLRGHRRAETPNTFDPPDPRFDAQFVPQAPQYAGGRLSAGEGAGGGTSDAAAVIAAQLAYCSRTSITELMADRLARSVFLPDGHSTSTLSTVSAAPSPKYSGYRLCDR